MAAHLMTEQEARDYISAAYPSAKFETFSYSEAFMSLEADIGKPFYFVTLYDERIGSNHIETKEGIIIVSNSYIPSFAYNLMLAWLYEQKSGLAVETIDSQLLRYNLKKFFGEQLYHEIDNVFSRAILLETLLYEQEAMIPVFKEMDTNPSWKATALFVANIMSNLVLFHELGHYYLQTKPKDMFLLFREHAQIVQSVLAKIDKLEDALAEEVKCDMISVLLLVLGEEPDKDELFQLKSICFGYAILPVLYSLQSSARYCAHEHAKVPDNVDLDSFQTSTQEYTFYVGIASDRDSLNMLRRAELVIELCEQASKHRHLDLYGVNETFTIHADLLKYLLSYVESVLDTDNVNQRNMARLVAESFSKHPKGMQYLYMKSKIFKARKDI